LLNYNLSMQEVSHLLQKLSESATLAMARKSRELKAQGIDVISLSLGEPDFNTPEFIKTAAKQAIDDNYSHYPPVNGYVELRQSIAHKFKRDNGLSYTADQIVVSTGAKQSIANVILSLINPGDEVQHLIGLAIMNWLNSLEVFQWRLNLALSRNIKSLLHN
jgi:aspartate aminotransferase